ncbi:MAG: hypothetical protein ACLT76_10615 [Clostridium fessum]
MARGESRKRKPGTPDYRKRFWAAVTAIVVAAGSIGVSHAGFTLPNQAQKQVQMAAAETEPAEQTAKKQVLNAAKRSLELEMHRAFRRRMQRRLRTRASWRATKRRRAASGVSMRQCMRLRTCSTCVRAVERSMRL